MLESQNLTENPDYAQLQELVNQLIVAESVNGLQSYDYNMSTIGKYPTNTLVKDIVALLAKLSKGKCFSWDEPDKMCYGGVAIKPSEAYSCGLEDIIRTTRFIAGLCKAITEAQKKFPNEQIQVVDAGCGPLGLLSVAAMTQFDPEKVQFTLIDVFESSIKSVQEIIKNLQAEKFIKQYLVDDAAIMELPLKPHVIVSEVMDRALGNEPQVTVTGNLSKQLKKGGIFVPEKITVTLNCYEQNDFKDFTPSETILGTIVELTTETAQQIVQCMEGKKTDGSIKITREFEISLPRQEYMFFAATAVNIFAEHHLPPRSATITLPIYSCAMVAGNGTLIVSCSLGGKNPENDFRLKFRLSR